MRNPVARAGCSIVDSSAMHQHMHVLMLSARCTTLPMIRTQGDSGPAPCVICTIVSMVPFQIFCSGCPAARTSATCTTPSPLLLTKTSNPQPSQFVVLHKEIPGAALPALPVCCNQVRARSYAGGGGASLVTVLA